MLKSVVCEFFGIVSLECTVVVRRALVLFDERDADLFVVFRGGAKQLVDDLVPPRFG
jgi:hypothetical protein